MCVPRFNRVALHHGGVGGWRGEVGVEGVVVAVMVVLGLKGYYFVGNTGRGKYRALARQAVPLACKGSPPQEN